MRHSRRLLCTFAVVLVIATAAVRGQSADEITSLANQHQRDLRGDGRAFLLAEVGRASFLLVGGLHGDNETQALVQLLSPGLGDGPILALLEMSPWTANRAFAAIADSPGFRLRGGDIEEAQIAGLLGALAAANPENRVAQDMLALVKAGYDQAVAVKLLALARQLGDIRDSSPGGVQLSTQVLRTLEVEADRSRPETADLTASLRREAVMKEFFLAHYRAATTTTTPKVVAAFGRNHLHRGIDRRGVPTLGNFIAEFAVAEGKQAFNVAMFAAGGRIAWNGLREWDERPSDPAFAYLASLAKSPVTVFDMRPLREPLRAIRPTARTPAQNSLLYWADSYDAVICYREVTPLGSR